MQLLLQFLFVYTYERTQWAITETLSLADQWKPSDPVRALREHNTENTVWQYRGQK